QVDSPPIYKKESQHDADRDPKKVAIPPPTSGRFSHFTSHAGVALFHLLESQSRRLPQVDSPVTISRDLYNRVLSEKSQSRRLPQVDSPRKSGRNGSGKVQT